MRYRPEIDGLRTVAILPVLFFHAGWDIFGGGYFGVDVFFVISGYLITAILFRNLENNQFLLKDFYLRRARRILPALFLVLLFTLYFGYFIFPGERFKDLFESGVSGILFFSNFHHVFNSGYFELNSLTSPLLHIWSLSVEEQFYLIYPAFLLVFWKKGLNKLFFFFFIAFLTSLALSHIGATSSWKEFNFYSPISRMWELLVGAIAAILLHRKKMKKSSLLSSIGFVFILTSIFCFDSETPHPSFLTLLPVVGAFLIIVYGSDKVLVAKILTTRPFVYIGLISYSLYLWHQPIMAYARVITLKEDLGFGLASLSILISFVFASLSWRYIEEPFRRGNSDTDKKKLVFYFSVVLFLIAVLPISFFYNQASGFKSLYKANSSEDFSYNVNKLAGKRALGILGFQEDSKWSNATLVYRKVVNSSCNILLAGDSHAEQYSNGFSELLVNETGCSVHSVTFTGCPPVVGFYKIFDIKRTRTLKKQNECKKYLKSWGNTFQRLDDSYDYKLVILSSRWNWLINGSSYGEVENFRMDALVPQKISQVSPSDVTALNRQSNFIEALKSTKDFYERYNKKVVIFSQPPVQTLDLRDYKSVEALDRALPSKAQAMLRYKTFEIALRKSGVIDNHSFFYFNTFNYFCLNGKNKCINREGNKSLYRDDDHLSTYGSEFVGRRFIKQFSCLLEESSQMCASEVGVR